MFLEEKTSGHRIVYTGDIRLHGPQKTAVESFIHAANAFHPDILKEKGS